MEELCRALPKAELHAHLHGSASIHTIAKLLDGKPDGEERATRLRAIADSIGSISLDECFEVFTAIHAAVRSSSDVECITRDVLQDFQKDNVCYLELRTTPRILDDTDEAGYVDCVVRAIRAHRRAFTAHVLHHQHDEDKHTQHPMIVRLLLSIDRGSATLSEAMETVKLALSLQAKTRKMEDGVTPNHSDQGSGGHQQTSYDHGNDDDDEDEKGVVVGIDFSGNPHKGEFSLLRPALEEARRRGLKVTVHVAEAPRHEETLEILDFEPDRLGHALCLDNQCEARLRALRTPVEICPTSNMRTLKLASLSEHPTLQWLLRANHPVSINTDDAGVFGTTPSQELALVARTYDLSREEVARLARAPLHHAFFECPREMAKLVERFERETVHALSTSSSSTL